MRNFFSYYPATTCLTLLQLLIFLIVHMNSSIERNFIYYGAAYHEWIWDGEIWRLVTGILLHTEFSHIFYNLFVLILIGIFLETYQSAIFIYAIFFTAGILANLMLLFHSSETLLHYGSSCAVSGLFGSILCLIYLKKIPLPLYSILVLFSGFFFHMLTSIFSLQTNTYGHFFGLITGIFLPMILHHTKKKKDV